MKKYIGKRMILSVFSIFVIATVIFLMTRVIPGDAFVNVQRTDPAIIEAMNQKYGLNDSLPVQYGKYLLRLLHFDLGISSYYQGKSVNQIISETFPISFRIAVFSTAAGFVMGLLTAAAAAMKEKKCCDYLIRFLYVLGISASVLVIAPVLQLVFGIWLGCLPIASIETPRHYILPVLSLGLSSMCLIGFAGRSAMIRVKKESYVQVARMKGLSKKRIFFTYILRNSLIPIVNMTMICFISNTIGAFYVESIYNIPGIGAVMVGAINNLDYGLIMGLTLFFGLLFITIIFLTDIGMAVIDPRIKVK